MNNIRSIVMKITVAIVTFILLAVLGFVLFQTPAGSGIIYLWNTDRANFASSFNHHHVLAFFIVRVLPLIISGYFLAKCIVTHKFWRRHLSKYNYIIFQIIFLFIALYGAELYLRIKGFVPNSFYLGCVPVSKLEDRSIQYSDSLGIIRYRPLNKWFPSFYNYINHDGFRCKYEYDIASIESLRNNGKLIMVIGDSFVDGASAIPRDSCFTDLLDAHPLYTALNFGQGGTDPLQYRLIAEQYIPKIKPDAVAVVIYDNDIMQYRRKPTPGIPMYYQTNANYMGGWMEAQKPIELGYGANDILRTPQEAYQFYSSFYTIPTGAGWLGWLCSKTALTTQLWYLTHKHFIKTIPPKEWEEGRPYTYENLQAVKELCEQYNCPLVFFYIPHVNEITAGPAKNEEIHKKTFRNLKLHIPSGIEIEDHVSLTYDTHFNNRGHAKFAAFMVSVLDTIVR